MKCDFCKNEVDITIGTDGHTFSLCNDCLTKVCDDLAKKRTECETGDENSTCECCEDCEDLEVELEVEYDDMF